ncbi:MAG: flavodoxin-dependent (E)-4-hydroxy-3-methylbut-2-enyl-diphosphate synthase [Candidatus Omnitrophica bacterium]|nr:flavodoxin-dependent (E)-4-hydroxy-3-methylbut-2-enyl-diphosphate synthase [Candidatus Omnitrophota bacterium]MBU4488477.1 flavodoxin-dependent (E)-4-hydroxy-3-methylbut-2-enyl-diphosphate synthase [Candidatus Omnitrophota bacterium]MCG2705360.1 flavodoxin-dependent (E)-4-hydroxy-3-methylbut-2-enyl-diphosphate synthase [Candidatus Omnitrophota bacterium]
MIKRRKTRKVKIGDVEIGGGAPISIQSMTKTDTKNVRATLAEIEDLAKAGCEIVRIAVKDHASMPPLRKIIQKSALPVETDIHFIPQLALDAIGIGAAAIRLNPGNINKEEDVKRIAKAAERAGVPIRIGVNSGSLVPPGRKSPAGVALKGGSIVDSMVKSALIYTKIFEKSGFRDIMISLKSSSVLETIEAYRKMAGFCDYPFHLGITAAGPLTGATVKSAIGIGALLLEGIGDTVRVSLTDDAVKEVEVAKDILSSLRLRYFGPEIISCPTCGRCQVDLTKVVRKLEQKLNAIRYPLSAGPITIAVMGCEVNGPGEAAHADIGIAAGRASGILFKKGRIVKRVKESDFVKEIIKAL